MCGGPLQRLCHWGPLTALGITKCISYMTLTCSTMWWPPAETLGGFLNAVIFAFWNGMTLYHFFCAMYIGPGWVPPEWKPENEEDVQYLQYCEACKAYKAPRSHHCRKCKRCVLKMDHHCPWINNCCGNNNHGHFTCFLLSAVMGCSQGAVVIGFSLYHALNRVWYQYYGTGREPIIYLDLHQFILGIFSLGLSLGVVVAVGMLLFIQVKGIYKNETGIESWIVEKADRLRPEGEVFIYPYNLGWKENFKMVFHRWSCEPASNGIFWPVVKGCNQYTLTVEQIQQKSEKRERTRQYTICKPYSGSWFPITMGPRICCSFPWSDESRIALQLGDKVLVTRWKRHWLYGERFQKDEKLIIAGGALKVRGWFPRKCAIEIIDDDNDKSELLLNQDKNSKQPEEIKKEL